MRKLFTPLLSIGNRQQEAAPPAFSNRYILSNLDLPYSQLKIGLE